VKISDALEGIQRLYTEAAPLIYYVEEHPKYVAKMDAIIKAIEDRLIEAVSSVDYIDGSSDTPCQAGQHQARTRIP
jgi:hypothetical protein